MRTDEQWLHLNCANVVVLGSFMSKYEQRFLKEMDPSKSTQKQQERLGRVVGRGSAAFTKSKKNKVGELRTCKLAQARRGGGLSSLVPANDACRCPGFGLPRLRACSQQGNFPYQARYTARFRLLGSLPKDR